MWRALTPYFARALRITVINALAYSFGVPVWLVYVGISLAVLVVLPGYERWSPSAPWLTPGVPRLPAELITIRPSNVICVA